MSNPEYSSNTYGRLYNVKVAQNSCPKGWHIPSDAEWDNLEIAHGMDASYQNKGGWRGEHSKHLRSKHGWSSNENGTDSLGFNVLPAGYYFSEAMAPLAGLDGYGFSAAFWSSSENGIAQARFMFGARVFVNKWADTDNDSGAYLSCRCVKD